MITYKTSESHPLRIDSFTLWNGEIGMTLCPGKTQTNAISGNWKRNLDTDIQVIKNWGANTVITLMEQHELDTYKIADLPNKMTYAFENWYHLPIVDRNVPDKLFMNKWHNLRLELAQQLVNGNRVLLHCLGGLGRTGLVASLLAMDAGLKANDAIKLVRKTRQGTIETLGQEQFVENYMLAQDKKIDEALLNKC